MASRNTTGISLNQRNHFVFATTPFLSFTVHT